MHRRMSDINCGEFGRARTGRDEEPALFALVDRRAIVFALMSGRSSFQVQPEDIELLRRRWHGLTSRHTDDEPARGAAFDSIAQHYSAENRAYHNLSHIKALLSLYDELRNDEGDDAIPFAI